MQSSLHPKKMKQRANFTKLIQVWGIILIVGVAGSISVYDIIGYYRDFRHNSEAMRLDHIARQKQIIKQEVVQVVDLISYEKNQSEILTRSKIKSKVYEAHAIAHNIYQQNKTLKSEAEIQKMIVDALRPIRFENNTGYYFAARMDDGVPVLTPDHPELEGKSLFNMQDPNGQYVIRDIIDIVQQSGEGFYEYHWTKPDTEGHNFKKISFVIHFEPYGWYIGTGLYVDDIEGQIKANLLSTISRIRFGKEGYIFINRLNGDALVSNGKLISGTKKLWEVFNRNPEKTEDLYKKEYKAALKPGGDFIYYTLIKLTTPDIESPKVSFIYGIPDLQWLVGAGVYLDDVETDIALMQAELNDHIIIKILEFSLITLGILAFFLFLFSRFNVRLKNDLNLFSSFFKQAAQSNEAINLDLVQFNELDQMAKNANKMLHDKIHVQKKLITEREVLRQKEALLSMSQEVAHVGSWELDMLDDRLVWSDEVYRIFGLQPQEFRATYEAFLEAVHPDDRAELDAIFAKSLQEGKNGYEIEHRVLHKHTGELRYVHEKCIHLQDETGRIVRSIGIVQDITERKEAELLLLKANLGLEQRVKERTAELRETNEKLQYAKEDADAANLAKSEFLANMSHEIRTPLNAVTGFSELLSSLVSDSTQKSYLESIKTAGKSLLTLINDILDLSKIEAGRLDINFSQVDPHLIFSEIEQIFKLRVIGKGLQFIVDIDEDLPTSLVLDETRLRQVLLNLVGNAVKFTEKGHIRLVARGVFGDESQSKLDLIISVEDTGIGIAEEDRQNIFEAFKQQSGQDSKKFGGTGLGLSISRRLIKMMNGDIEVHGTKGQGSRFEITLRDVAVSSSELTVIQETSLAMEDIYFSPAKILVVDDVESNRDLLCELLSRVNLNVLTAEDGREAIKLVAEYQPDLIIMDIRMPVMDGIEATDRLKKNPDSKSTPVIALTASAKPSDRTDIIAANFDGYLTKPVRIQALMAELAKYLSHTIVEEPTPSGAAQIEDEQVEEQLCDLAGLVNSLQKLQSTCQKMAAGGRMGDIKQFGHRLQELGQKHNSHMISNGGKELTRLAGEFDIITINKRLQQFPEIVATIAGKSNYVKGTNK